MTEESTVTFGMENFDRGARTCFVKENGAIARDIKAAFSIESENVKKRYATHSFVEFVNVSTGACLVQKPGSDACVFVVTDAKIERDALREIARRICVDVKCPVFFYAGAKLDMLPLVNVEDKRFASYAETMLAAARRLFEAK